MANMGPSMVTGTPLVSDGDNGRLGVCGGRGSVEGRGAYGNSVYSQFCYKPKKALNK